ncbi:hypothetical protein L798_09823 [Zootermopsis nevadensis]|uniref:Uncharacterized protein n=1 Tax=Zootermopsis nevadensis TaxID=136037 RepID=A0A067QZM5_ZOONE|nr:hypothetical protein L798_09823 [Zootermopsis nevadensis]
MKDSERRGNCLFYVIIPQLKNTIILCGKNYQHLITAFGVRVGNKWCCMLRSFLRVHLSSWGSSVLLRVCPMCVPCGRGSSCFGRGTPRTPQPRHIRNVRSRPLCCAPRSAAPARPMRR